MTNCLIVFVAKLFTLGDDYKVYCGHGPATTIGFEKQNNSFLKENLRLIFFEGDNSLSSTVFLLHSLEINLQ